MRLALQEHTKIQEELTLIEEENGDMIKELKFEIKILRQKRTKMRMKIKRTNKKLTSTTLSPQQILITQEALAQDQDTESTLTSKINEKADKEKCFKFSIEDLKRKLHEIKGKQKNLHLK